MLQCLGQCLDRVGLSSTYLKKKLGKEHQPEPPIDQCHGYSRQGKRVSLSVLEHLVRHQETSHHEEYLHDDAGVEQERLEEVAV